MARFIAIEIEYPDPEDEDGTKPLKSKTIFFSPLKVKYLKEFRDIINELHKKGEEDDEKMKNDPNFVPDRFDGLDQVGMLLLKLAQIKHKKMTKEEFEEDISISDYRKLMSELASEVDVWFMEQNERWDRINKVINEDYPETYIYFFMGKIFGWAPDVIDELDVKLCNILIEIEIKIKEEEAEELEKIRGGTSRATTVSQSMPEEWKAMSVKDILATKEFKSREQDNENKLKAIKNTYGGQTGVIKNYIKIE